MSLHDPSQRRLLNDRQRRYSNIDCNCHNENCYCNKETSSSKMHTPEGTQASLEMLGLARISDHRSETQKVQYPLREVVQPEGTPQHQSRATVVVG